MLFLATLGPVLLVGVASYWTARSIMGAKIRSQLAAEANATAARIEHFTQERLRDTEVFSNALLVVESLATPSGPLSVQARERLELYLDQIRERYPLYRALFVVDRSQQVVAAVTSGPDGPDMLPENNAAVETDVLVRGIGGQALLFARNSIKGEDGVPIGALVTAAEMEELWQTLVEERPLGNSRLQIYDESDRLLFDTNSESSESVGSNPPPGEKSGLIYETVSEYRNEAGRLSVGAHYRLSDSGAALLVEVERDTAFSAINQLRNFTLTVSMLGLVLFATVGYFIVLNLTRPIELLIAGVKAASAGDLTGEIVVSSRDQIGYLTQAFNQMIRSLRETQGRLEVLSSTDELTGLPNRRHLVLAFDAEVSRATRTDSPLSVLMIDLDHFKRFNDHHGHIEGDSVLQELGAFLREHLRPTDLCGRYGGEEFVILLPDTSKSEALELSERLRHGFSQNQPHDIAGTGPVTFSVGLASYPEEGESREDLLRAADTALYQAKSDGRNRVRVAGSAA